MRTTRFGLRTCARPNHLDTTSQAANGRPVELTRLTPISEPSCYTPRMDYPGRIRRLQAALDDNRLDALLVTHLPNVRYLCGFTGSAGVLLVHRSQVIFFTDGRYRTQAREEVSDARIVIATKTPSLAATEMLAPAGARKTRLHVGIESQSVTLAQR